MFMGRDQATLIGGRIFCFPVIYLNVWLHYSPLNLSVGRMHDLYGLFVYQPLLIIFFQSEPALSSDICEYLSSCPFNFMLFILHIAQFDRFQNCWHCMCIFQCSDRIDENYRMRWPLGLPHYDIEGIKITILGEIVDLWN